MNLAVTAPHISPLFSFLIEPIAISTFVLQTVFSCLLQYISRIHFALSILTWAGHPVNAPTLIYTDKLLSMPTLAGTHSTQNICFSFVLYLFSTGSSLFGLFYIFFRLELGGELHRSASARNVHSSLPPSLRWLTLSLWWS